MPYVTERMILLRQLNVLKQLEQVYRELKPAVPPLELELESSSSDSQDGDDDDRDSDSDDNDVDGVDDSMMIR
jgi:hypothetical protein